MPTMLLSLPSNLQLPPKAAIVGVDEAGRGSWAGPVVAAAVIWPDNLEDLGINDSKQLTFAAREQLFSIVMENAVGVGVGIATSLEIDEVGVGEATHLAMRRATEKLGVRVDLIVVDGYSIDFGGVQSMGMIHGDAKYIPIAAASIVAKVTRDRLMIEMSKQYPEFEFAAHKGYGTVLHQQRIDLHGLCPEHRKSFAPIRAKLEQASIKLASVDG